MVTHKRVQVIFLQSANDGFRCSSAVAHLNRTHERKNLDVIVEEYKIGRVLRKNGTMKKFENPTLF